MSASRHYCRFPWGCLLWYPEFHTRHLRYPVTEPKRIRGKFGSIDISISKLRYFIESSYVKVIKYSLCQRGLCSTGTLRMDIVGIWCWYETSGTCIRPSVGIRPWQTPYVRAPSVAKFDSPSILRCPRTPPSRRRFVICRWWIWRCTQN
jgi:hypothetical protein